MWNANKIISDGGIAVDFWIIKVHTSNWSSNSRVTRERALGGSRRGVKGSWQEALLMPPASRLTELLTRKRLILQDRISLPSFRGIPGIRITFLLEEPLVPFLHGAKTSLFYLGDHLYKEDGSPCLSGRWWRSPIWIWCSPVRYGPF